jgi:hypothetical protein
LAAKLLEQPPDPLSWRNTMSVSRTATAPKLIPTTTPDTQNNLKTGSVATGSSASTTGARNASTAKALDTKSTTAADSFAKEMARDSFDASAASNVVNLGGSRPELGKLPALPAKAGQPEGRSGEAEKSSSSGLSKDGAGALTGTRPTLNQLPTDKTPNPTSLAGTKFADLDPSVGMSSASTGNPGENMGARLATGKKGCSDGDVLIAVLKGAVEGATDGAGLALVTGLVATVATGGGAAPALPGLVASGAGLGAVSGAYGAVKEEAKRCGTKMPGVDKLPDLLPGQDSLAKEAMNRIIDQKTRSTDTWKVRLADTSDAGSRDASQPAKTVNGLVNPASLEMRDYSAAAAKTQDRAVIGAQSVINPVRSEASLNGRKPG